MICIYPVKRCAPIGQADLGHRIACYGKIDAAFLRSIWSEKGPIVYDKSAWSSEDVANAQELSKSIGNIVPTVGKQALRCHEIHLFVNIKCLFRRDLVA